MGRDRGPLLSSLVLVGLATMATALLVLIGVQAVKLPFDPRNAGTGSEHGGDLVIPVPTVTTGPPVVTGGGRPSAPAPTSGPASVRTTSPTQRGGNTGSNTGTNTGTNTGGNTGTVTKAPAPQPTSNPTTTAPAPRPQPSQSTATTRPTPPPAQPSPSPSPTCTAKDRSGKCKNAADSPPTAEPATRSGSSTGGTVTRSGTSTGGTAPGKAKVTDRKPKRPGPPGVADHRRSRLAVKK